jgi:hypothetical protein
MEVDRERRSELVTLPSGTTAKLVRPTPAELFLRTGLLPQSVAARFASEDAAGALASEELVHIAQQTVDLCRFVFFAPRVPDELQPGIDIPASDVEWALRWARGEVASDGSSLAEFRGEVSGADASASKTR